MKWWIFLLLTATAPAQVRVAGTVADTAGNPIEGAVVLYGALGGQRAMTAADGAFAFPSVNPGGYLFRVDRNGFAPLRDAAYTEVGDQPVNGIRVTMTREGVIRGTIANPAGEPAAGVIVNVLERTYEYGVRSLYPRGSATTGPDGAYRIGGLAPGSYYVRVNGRGGATVGRGSFGMSIGPPQLRDIESYYPGGVDEAEARRITLAEGAEVTGIDIRTREGLRYTIRGQLVDAEGQPLAQVPMMIQAESDGGYMDDRLALMAMGKTTRPSDGGFEFRNLAPGRYWIVSATAGAAVWERMAVTVTDDDVEGVIVRARAGVDVTARIEMENGAQPRYGLNLSLTPPGIGSQVRMTRFGEPLEFRSLVPGDYRLRIDNMPLGTYIKSIHLGDRDVTHRLLDIRRPETLRVVLSERAGWIQGTLPPGLRPGVRVVLWPREPHPEWTAQGVWSVAADQNGVFRFPGVDPGAYLLAAWEAAPGLTDTYYAFADRFRDAALAVEVGQEQELTVEAPLIPAARILEEYEKLP